MALETQIKKRRTCSECTPRLQRRRGCRKGSNNHGGDEVTKWTSPLLQISCDLHECPTGYLLREAPWVWDAIEAAGLAENATPTEWARQGRWYQHCVRLVVSERARLVAEKRENERARDHSKTGMRAR